MYNSFIKLLIHIKYIYIIDNWHVNLNDVPIQHSTVRQCHADVLDQVEKSNFFGVS